MGNTILRKKEKDINLDKEWTDLQALKLNEANILKEHVLYLEKQEIIAKLDAAKQAYQAELTLPVVQENMGRKDKELVKFLGDKVLSINLIADYFRGRNSVNQRNYPPDNSFADYIQGKITITDYLKITATYGAVIKLSRGRILPTSWYIKHQPYLVSVLKTLNIIE